MSLYDLEEETDIYGYNNNELENPIQYLIGKTQQEPVPRDVKSYMNEVQGVNKEMKQVVKSKYNLFKGNEPQTPSGGKRFLFKRK